MAYFPHPVVCLPPQFFEDYYVHFESNRERKGLQQCSKNFGDHPGLPKKKKENLVTYLESQNSMMHISSHLNFQHLDVN